MSVAVAHALIPANDDEDEELVSKAKANRQRRIVEEKDTEQVFAKSEGYNGVTLLTIERGVKKLAKSGSELEAGNLSSVAKLVRYFKVTAVIKHLCRKRCSSLKHALLAVTHGCQSSRRQQIQWQTTQTLNQQSAAPSAASTA